MRVHLFTSDPSGLDLAGLLPSGAEITAVILPDNRAASDKVAAAETAAGSIPVYRHRLRQPLGADLPEADVAICWLYSQIIRPEDLTRYPGGTLNMHGGRIPQFRGANVLHWAIIAGEAELGITWHGLVEEVDAGPIWAESTIPIRDEDDAAMLRARMVEAGLELFPAAWAAMSANRVLRIPDLGQGRVWPSRKPADGEIRPGMTARALRDLVRALCPPWPAAFVMRDGERLDVRAVLEHPTHGSLPYVTADGQVLHLAQSRPVS